jgi:hypothetical protein
MKAWLEGLRERGSVVGGNTQIEYRNFHGRYEQIPALAAELAALGPEPEATRPGSRTLSPKASSGSSSSC